MEMEGPKTGKYPRRDTRKSQRLASELCRLAAGVIPISAAQLIATPNLMVCLTSSGQRDQFTLTVDLYIVFAYQRLEVAMRSGRSICLRGWLCMRQPLGPYTTPLSRFRSLEERLAIS